MIVQPLVENAIRHDIRDCDYPGEVHVRAFAQGDAVVLSVRDNGVGFPEDKIRRLTGDGKIERDGEGFGLASVIDRLRIYYDPICSLEITNHERGCTVSILIRRKEAA
jgi:sensor histidine kinase YesM